MTKQVIEYTNRDAWLRERLRDITSTECAALFGASPYATAFEIYYAKKDGVAEAIADNERMRWGRRLQDPIAHYVAEDCGIEVRKKTEYIRDTETRVGASFDFEIVAATGGDYKKTIDDKGAGLMEIKTVDPVAFAESWDVVDGNAVEAPPHIELQVQHQLLVSGLQWALIVALVGGNRVSIIERAYDPDLGAHIMQKAREFWEMVERGTPPAPDYTRDAATIRRLYLNSVAGKLLDARNDTDLAKWVEEYQARGQEIKYDAERRDVLRAYIFERIGDASRVLLANGTISAGTVKETTVAAFTRAAFRNLRITTTKEKATP
jgi:putative phage-type endonuclease